MVDGKGVNLGWEKKRRKRERKRRGKEEEKKGRPKAGPVGDHVPILTDSAAIGQSAGQRYRMSQLASIWFSQPTIDLNHHN